MLLIKTVVRKSPIAGLGLFADQDVEIGQEIWRYTTDTCSLITKKQFLTFVESAQKDGSLLIEHLLNYSYFVTEFDGVVLDLDDAQFINHSKNPNVVDSHAWKYSVASRPIKRGEELTNNYCKYDTCDWIEELYKKYKVYAG